MGELVNFNKPTDPDEEIKEQDYDLGTNDTGYGVDDQGRNLGPEDAEPVTFGIDKEVIRADAEGYDIEDLQEVIANLEQQYDRDEEEEIRLEVYKEVLAEKQAA